MSTNDLKKLALDLVIPGGANLVSMVSELFSNDNLENNLTNGNFNGKLINILFNDIKHLFKDILNKVINDPVILKRAKYNHKISVYYNKIHSKAQLNRLKIYLKNKPKFYAYLKLLKLNRKDLLRKRKSLLNLTYIYQHLSYFDSRFEGTDFKLYVFFRDNSENYDNKQFFVIKIYKGNLEIPKLNWSYSFNFKKKNS